MNYNIENGLNFYETLKQNIASHSSENERTTDEGLCLISNTPLEDRFFTFECGHKFNYEPIYKDIYNHKKKYNYMEGVKGRLNMNEIRCPFCRKRQTGILPYYSELPFDKVHGVNFINPEIVEYANGKSLAKCQYMILDETDTNITVTCTHVGNVITSEFCFCYMHYIKHKNDEKLVKAAAKVAEKAAEKEAKAAQKKAEKEANAAQKKAEKEANAAQKKAEKEAKVAAKVAAKVEAKVAEKATKTAEKAAQKEAKKNSK